jgi:hypothetical protein
MDYDLTILSSNKHRYSIYLYFILYDLNTKSVIDDEFIKYPYYNNMVPSDYYTYVRDKLPSTLNEKTIILLNKMSYIYKMWYEEPSFPNILYLQHNALYYARLYNNAELIYLYKNNIKKINENARVLNGLHKLIYNMDIGLL